MTPNRFAFAVLTLGVQTENKIQERLQKESQNYIPKTCKRVGARNAFDGCSIVLVP